MFILFLDDNDDSTDIDDVHFLMWSQMLLLEMTRMKIRRIWILFENLDLYF